MCTGCGARGEVWEEGIVTAKGLGHLLQNSLFFLKRHKGRCREEEAELGGSGGENDCEALRELVKELIILKIIY